MGPAPACPGHPPTHRISARASARRGALCGSAAHAAHAAFPAYAAYAADAAHAAHARAPQLSNAALPPAVMAGRWWWPRAQAPFAVASQHPRCAGDDGTGRVAAEALPRERGPENAGAAADLHHRSLPASATDAATSAAESAAESAATCPAARATTSAVSPAHRHPASSRQRRRKPLTHANDS